MTGEDAFAEVEPSQRSAPQKLLSAADLQLTDSGAALAEPHKVGTIDVVGGESTGKSTLADALADALPAALIPEVLRDWVDAHGRVPTAAEQAEIVSLHIDAQRRQMARADRSGWKWVVRDSGPLMTAAYSVHYFGDDSLIASAVAATERSRLVVWCAADIPWQPDPQRDGEGARSAVQQVLGQIFADYPQLPVLPVAGSVAQRVAQVRAALTGEQGHH